MRAGFGLADVTPPRGAPMMGQLVAYENTGVESPLLASALVLTDREGTTVAFVVADVLLMADEDAASARQAIAKDLGCPEAHVVVSATHTHSGPSTRALFGQQQNASYLATLMAGLVEAARVARAAQQPARLSWGAGECRGLAFNRRYVMADGSIETHPLKSNPFAVEAEGPDSDALHILSATSSEDGAPLGAARLHLNGDAEAHAGDRPKRCWPAPTAEPQIDCVGDGE